MRPKLLILISLLCLSLPATLLAGNEPRPTGGRMTALGGAYSGIRANFWGLFNNPASIAGIDKMEAGIFVERSFLVQNMNYGAAGFVLPFKENHVVGLDLSGFGFTAYMESRVGLSYATTIFDRIHLGVKANLANTSIQNYGNGFGWFIDVGVNAEIIKGLSIGFRASNVNRGVIVRETKERIPTVISGGLAYQITDKVLVVADVEKQIEFPVSFKGGIEYRFIDFLSARVGISTAPVSLSAGLGFEMKGIQVDFASSYHERLGYTPHLSASYSFGKPVLKKKAPELPTGEDQ